MEHLLGICVANCFGRKRWSVCVFIVYVFTEHRSNPSSPFLKVHKNGEAERNSDEDTRRWFASANGEK
jgi:hypothetical protein